LASKISSTIAVIIYISTQEQRDAETNTIVGRTTRDEPGSWWESRCVFDAKRKKQFTNQFKASIFLPAFPIYYLSTKNIDHGPDMALGLGQSYG
jgi:hypothetical protein